MSERLAEYMPDFEVYLQFDSLERDPLIELRGVDLRAVRRKALERTRFATASERSPHE